MESIILGSKAKIVEDQMSHRSGMGSKYFEAHTDMKFLDEHSVGECKRLADKVGMVCYSIHAPFRDEFGSVGIGTIDSIRLERITDYIVKCLRYAEDLCEVEVPSVVVHCDSYVRMEKLFNMQSAHRLAEEGRRKTFEVLDEIVNVMEKEKLRSKLLIENVMKYNTDSEGRLLARIYGSDFDADKIVEIYGDNRIGTTLDICHALSDINLYKVVQPFKDVDISHYIKSFSNSIGLVHMSNGRNFGRGPKEHGVLFETDSEILLLDKIVRTMIRFNYSVPLTLELGDMHRYVEFREQLVQMFGEHGKKCVY